MVISLIAKWTLKWAASIRRDYLFEAFLVFAVSYLVLQYVQFQHPYLFGYDGYYHIKYSYLLRMGEITDAFPWAQFSLWEHAFADKEYLFHYMLIPFTYFSDLITGGKHAAVFFGSLIFASFLLFLRLHNAPVRYLWLCLLLSEGFIYRLLMIRPHLLAIFFSIWIVHCIIKRRYPMLTFLCVIYTLTYTAYHMPLVLGLAILLGQFLQQGYTKKNMDLKLLKVLPMAILFAMIVSPFFPKNIVVFFENNVMALLYNLSGIDLDQGTELIPHSTRDFLISNLMLLIPLLATVYLSIAHPKRLSPATLSLMAVCAVYFLLATLSRRFIEYLHPFGLLYCALYFRDRLGTHSLKDFLQNSRVKFSLLISALMLSFAFTRSYQVAELSANAKPPFFKGSSEYLKQVAPKDETVFTCNWYQSTEMFFYNHQQRYMVFLDPVYMYSWDRNVWKHWQAIVGGEYKDNTSQFIVENLNLRYGICNQSYAKLREEIDNDPHSYILYEDAHAYVFFIDMPLSNEI